jgi:hypothetical protein
MLSALLDGSTRLTSNCLELTLRFTWASFPSLFAFRSEAKISWLLLFSPVEQINPEVHKTKTFIMQEFFIENWPPENSKYDFLA